MSRGTSRLMRYRTSGLFHLAWQAMFASCLLGQAAPTQPKNPDQNAAQGEIRIAEASRVDTAPKLDGTLDDPLWQQAKPSSELRRDVSQHLDDYFEIVIDSAHDRRNAYFSRSHLWVPSVTR